MYQMHGISSVLGARGNGKRIPMEKMSEKEEKSQRRLCLFIIILASLLLILGVTLGFLGL